MQNPMKIQGSLSVSIPYLVSSRYQTHIMGFTPTSPSSPLANFKSKVYSTRFIHKNECDLIHLYIVSLMLSYLRVCTIEVYINFVVCIFKHNKVYLLFYTLYIVAMSRAYNGNMAAFQRSTPTSMLQPQSPNRQAYIKYCHFIVVHKRY